MEVVQREVALQLSQVAFETTWGDPHYTPEPIGGR